MNLLEVGTDFILSTCEQALCYTELPYGETPRLKVFDIYRKLSLARGVTEDEARWLSGEGK